MDGTPQWPRPWRRSSDPGCEEQPPGVIVVVRREGKTRFFPFGEADKAHHKAVTPDTVFELASITKVFTTTSLPMEVEAGNVQLDDPVTKYLPYLREHGGDIRSVTLRQLATHTSSLPRSPDASRPDGGWNKQSVMQWLAQWRAPYPPGTRSLYSNLGVGLLGYAIAGYEKRPLIEVWERTVSRTVADEAHLLRDSSGRCRPRRPGIRSERRARLAYSPGRLACGRAAKFLGGGHG